MNNRGAEMVIGLMGGVFALMAGWFGYAMRTVSPVLKHVNAKTLEVASIVTIILSVVGIAGALLVVRRPKLGGLLMLIAGIGVIVSMRVYDSMGGILLIVTGLMGLFRKVRQSQARV